MQRLIIALAAATALAAPVAAQSLSTLLPQLSFPEPVVTPGTKGCDALPSGDACQIGE